MIRADFNPEMRPTFEKYFGFLMEWYRCKVMSWDILAIICRAMLIAINTALFTDRVRQAAIWSLFSMIYLLAHLLLGPFSTSQTIVLRLCRCVEICAISFLLPKAREPFAIKNSVVLSMIYLLTALLLL